jgi:hypothetical protein
MKSRGRSTAGQNLSWKLTVRMRPARSAMLSAFFRLYGSALGVDVGHADDRDGKRAHRFDVSVDDRGRAADERVANA